MRNFTILRALVAGALLVACGSSGDSTVVSRRVVELVDGTTQVAAGTNPVATSRPLYREKCGGGKQRRWRYDAVAQVPEAETDAVVSRIIKHWTQAGLSIERSPRDMVLRAGDGEYSLTVAYGRVKDSGVVVSGISRCGKR